MSQEVDKLIESLEEKHSEWAWWEAYCYGMGGFADRLIRPTRALQKQLKVPADRLLDPDDLRRYLTKCAKGSKSLVKGQNRTQRMRRRQLRPAAIPPTLRRALLIDGVVGAEKHGYERLWASPRHVEGLFRTLLTQISMDHQRDRVYEHRLHPIGIRSKEDIARAVRAAYVAPPA